MSDTGFKGKVPGAWRVPQEFRLTDHASIGACVPVLPNLAIFVPDALSEEDCTMMRDLFAQQGRAPVAVSGYQTADPDDVGSVRATGWGPELGQHLWRKLRPAVDYAFGGRATMDDYTPTDWFSTPTRAEHRAWRPTGVSPVLRFMEYAAGGRHNTHYDMGFDYEAHDPHDHRRTLLSVVWYLNDEPGTGGRTRFIEDGQERLPVRQRNLDDWTRSAAPEEVKAARSPQRGGALLFWHRMAHDVEQFTGKSRIIVRGDVEFTALD